MNITDNNIFQANLTQSHYFKTIPIYKNSTGIIIYWLILKLCKF
jgi:hypothetical protein